MVRACEAAGTTLLVNWPLTWSAAARKAKVLIDEGVIGRVLEVKWRAGHTGPLGPSAAHAGVSEIVEGMTGPERGATWWHQSAAARWRDARLLLLRRDGLLLVHRRDRRRPPWG